MSLPFLQLSLLNGLSNVTLGENVPLVSVKSTLSLLFWHKILIPNFKCYCHEGLCMSRSVHVAERLALPTLDHGVAGSNPTGGEILPKPKWRFIAQNRSCSPFHCLEMTEILLKGCKTLTHPSILCMSQHTGSHKNSLSWLGEKYLNESHWPMRRIRLLECTLNSLQHIRQNHWTMKYRPLAYIYSFSSMFVSHWINISSTTLIH